jgi:hypothetical protein
MKKLLWVKFGWSDYYRGGPVDGNFGWLNRNKGKRNEGRGHEAFNFRPGPQGTYYGYVPPQGGNYAPSNDDPHGWTVVCLAKHPNYPGVHVVGWYENATLLGKWLDPPAGFAEKHGDSDHPAYDWSYCITSNSAFFVPPEYRVLPFSDTSVRQGKYSFLTGPDVETTSNKQRVLRILEGRMKKLAGVAIRNPSEANLPDPQIDAADPLKGFGTAEHRKKVEKAAEREVIAYYREKGFKPVRVTHLPCGHDFVFTKGKSVLHVEVKGTSSEVAQFYLTRNEHLIGMTSNPAWRLAMVTSALSQTPAIMIYRASELKRHFDIEPYVYRGKLIPKPVS